MSKKGITTYNNPVDLIDVETAFERETDVNKKLLMLFREVRRLSIFTTAYLTMIVGEPALSEGKMDICRFHLVDSECEKLCDTHYEDSGKKSTACVSSGKKKGLRKDS